MALLFNYIFDPDTPQTTEFRDAVEAAGLFFSNQFTNDVTINLRIKWASLGTRFLAKNDGNLNTVPINYTQLQQYLPNLPTSDPTSGQGHFIITRGEAKALGILYPQNSDLDATITFNSDFNWAYDPSQLIGPPSSNGQADFVATAEHEISEVLGRFAFQGSSHLSLTSNPYSVLDLFRYSNSGVPTLHGETGYFSTDNGITRSQWGRGVFQQFFGLR